MAAFHLLFAFAAAVAWAQAPAPAKEKDWFEEREQGLGEGKTRAILMMKEAGKPAGGGYRSATDVRDDLNRLVESATPVVRELQELKDRYEAAADLAAVDAMRDPLREKIGGLKEEFDALFLEFRTMLTREGLLKLRGVLAGGFKGEADGELADMLALQEYSKSIKGFAGMVVQVLAEDETAYQALKARLHARLVRNRVGAVSGAVLLLLGGNWLRRRRRKTQAGMISALLGDTLSGEIVSPASGPASGPVSGPASALLSGPTAAGPAPGAVLGGSFKVERQIGAGGMGVVYEATDLALKRKVAIKQMRSEVSSNRRELEMFLAEARLVASLKHPNIVEIYHIFNESETLYLVFEHVEGRPLEAHLEDGRRLPPRQVGGLLRQMAMGLDYAHSRKVIHRDMKPANVMVGPAGAVKIMDFGIAHQAKRTVARVTKSDSWGTPPYMAPEQELGTVSRESDLYALGAVVYEMLTGRPAFDGPNFLAQKREMVFAAPSDAAPDLPKGFDPVLRRALDAEAKNRFHTGAEFFNAFLAALGGKPAS